MHTCKVTFKILKSEKSALPVEVMAKLRKGEFELSLEKVKLLISRGDNCTFSEKIKTR